MNKERLIYLCQLHLNKHRAMIHIDEGFEEIKSLLRLTHTVHLGPRNLKDAIEILENRA